MFEEFDAAADTRPDIERLRRERLARMTPEERAKGFFQLMDTTRLFVLAGIRARHPGCSDDELRRHFAAVFLGREFADTRMSPESAEKRSR